MVKKRFRNLSTLLTRIKKEFNPEKVLLFGSRARGDYNKESDYDILIISKFFNNIDSYQRAVLAYNLKKGVLISADFICLTPEEFSKKQKQIGIIQEAVKEGMYL